MREFVQRQAEARDYEGWLRRKVEAGRADAYARCGSANDDVEAQFAGRRAAMLAEPNQ